MSSTMRAGGEFRFCPLLFVVLQFSLGSLPVGRDGVFSFSQLPPARYGLKVGHDAYKDSEVIDGLRPVSKEVWETPVDPWKRATVVDVAESSRPDNVVLRLPNDCGSP